MTSAIPGRSTLTATGVPSGSCGEVHLRDRCARDRLAIERREDLLDRPAEQRVEGVAITSSAGNGGTRS